MKREGIHWISVIVGISVVVVGWLFIKNSFTSTQPKSHEPNTLLSPEEEDGATPISGIRNKVPTQPPPDGSFPEFKPFELCLTDAITGLRLEGGEVLDNRTQKILGRTDTKGCLSLQGLDPGVLVIHCPGYFLSLVPEKARKVGRSGGRVGVALFPASSASFIEVQTSWPKNAPPPKGRLRIRIDRFGPSSIGERSYPTARFGEGSQVSPEARRAWENHSLLAGSVRTDEGWFLGGYGGVSLPPKGGRIYFPHRGKFLLRARDDSGAYWAKAIVKIDGQDHPPLVLPFAKGGTLSLRIQDPHGHPIPGARVVLSFPRETTGGRYEDISDDKGQVQLQGIAENQGGHLEVFAPDFRVKKVELPVLPRIPQDILMEPLPSEIVSFIVQEVRSHKPIPRVQVLVGNPAHPHQKAQSDNRGRVSIRLIPGQVRNLTLRKKGYLTYGELLQVSPGIPPPRIFELIPSDPEAQRKLGLVALIKGQILNNQGKPLAGAPVYLAIEGDGFIRVNNPLTRRVVRGGVPKSLTQTRSDAKGNFLLVSANGGKARLIWGGEPNQQRNFVVKAGQVLHFRLNR